ARAPLVDVAGSAQRLVPVDVEEGTHGAVDLLDAVQVRLGHLDRADLPGAQSLRQLRSCGRGQLTHASSPRICGTRNWPSSLAGAPARASATVSGSSTTSSRMTLVSGIGWLVAGTSWPTTSLTWATASAMTPSSPEKRSISSSVRSIRASAATRATSAAEMVDMAAESNAPAS